jgi:hypothetical protein
MQMENPGRNGPAMLSRRKNEVKQAVIMTK